MLDTVDVDVFLGRYSSRVLSRSRSFTRIGNMAFFFFLLSVCGKMTDVDATQWTVDSVVDLPHEEEILRMFVLILFKIIRDSVVGRFSLVARRLDCTTFAADWPQEGRTKPDGRVRVQ